LSLATLSSIGGLAKLAEFLQHQRQRKPPKKRVNWEHYVGPLPQWLADDVRAYVAHRRRAWIPEQYHRATIEVLCHLTLSLRWMADHATLTDISDLTPALWFDFLDARLEAGRRPNTVNRDLGDLQEFLRFLADAGRPVCERMLDIKPLPVGPQLPRDVPLDQLRLLMREIENDAASSNVGTQRMGVMDGAWFHLMLHCGLRVGEVRRLRLADLDLEARRVRVEKSKGLKDRVIYLSQPTADALVVYLEICGPATSDHLFIFRHQALRPSYFRHRISTYGKRCGVQVTPHRLRHTCATLLLNAGAPILAVQTILGHKHIDTTLGYARLYDGTIAADYYRAIGDIERRMKLQESTTNPPTNIGQLLALVDALQAVQELRAAILNLVEPSDETTGGTGYIEADNPFDNPGSLT
jgi:integrase